MRHHKDKGRVLKTGNYAGLKFEQGWFFIHVLETEEVELKPWVLLNENEERAELAPKTAGSTDDEVVDVVERQLIEPRGNEQELVFQLQFGIAPSRLQVFPFFGRDRAPNLTGGSEPGKPQVWATGYDSPYNNPTTQAEVFTVNNMASLALQAYNPTDEPIEPKLSIHVNKMKYAVVEDEGLMRAFIEGQQPFRDHTMGLGAQGSDQIRAPNWMLDRFGDVMLTTSEILEDNTANGGVAPELPENGGVE